MKRFLLALSVALMAVSGWAQEQFTGMWQSEALQATANLRFLFENGHIVAFACQDDTRRKASETTAYDDATLH